MFKDSAFIWYLAWGAVPAILSIILFWLTNSKASVSTMKTQDSANKTEGATSGSLISKLTDSPLKNLVINITGAAALFFLLFIIMNPIKTGFFEKEKSWQLRVDFRNDKGQSIPAEKLKSIEPFPTLQYDYNEQSVLVSLGNLREEKSKLKINYSLEVKFDGFETYTIPLTDSINESLFCRRVPESNCLSMKTVYLRPKVLDTLQAPVQPPVQPVLAVRETSITPPNNQ